MELRAVFVFVFRWALITSVLTLLAPEPVSAADVVLFDGGFKDAGNHPTWADRFGTFDGDRSAIRVTNTLQVDPNCEPTLSPCEHHAEAQHLSSIGGDFIYSADVTISAGADVHLQFRISDEGRYGIRLRTTGISFYEFRFPPRGPCSTKNPNAITHCPEWKEPDAQKFTCIQEVTAPGPNARDPACPSSSVLSSFPLASPSTHKVAVRARGSEFEVLFDGQPVFRALPCQASLEIGRFGIYVFGDPSAIRNVTFANVRASTDPVAPWNFALLYSTLGYEAGGTKRALVRTLNDIPGGVDITERSRFALRGIDGVVARTGALNRLPKTFGMQLWEADFTSVIGEGSYTLEVDVVTPLTGNVTTLRSAPFDIRSRLLSSHILKPMSLANAEVRRGADEDFWRNWQVEDVESGSHGVWSVGVDGAFIADRADTGAGATLTRVFNINNESIENLVTRARNNPQARDSEKWFNFRFVGRVTIVTGCDAQLRFEDTQRQWWAVTLRAGAAGGCPFNTGSGDVRLSVENASGFFEKKSFPFPFQIGHPYDVEILVRDKRIQVFVDKPQGITENPQTDFSPYLEYSGEDVLPRSGRFGLKAWGSTARFEDVQAWKDTVRFIELPAGSTRIPTFLNHDNADPVGQNFQVPCQYATKTCTFDPNGPENLKCRNPVFAEEEFNACNPIFGQLHGFHDSSSMVGEASSHGAFLSGLMQIWKSRGDGFAQAERESLRRAIVANVLYLTTLFNEGGQTGQSAHSEMGRVEVDINDPGHTKEWLYGASAFAADGAYIDRALADQMCLQATKSVEWLWPDGPANFPEDATLASVVYSRLARCIGRERSLGDNNPYWNLAIKSADAVLTWFITPGQFSKTSLHVSRIIPWLEGVFEILQIHPELRSKYAEKLNRIADTLTDHLTNWHWCNDIPPLGGGFPCPPNGFEVLPQATGNEKIWLHNWTQMEMVPKAEAHSDKLPYAQWYNVTGHFQSAAIDAVLLARMVDLNSARAEKLERVAAGNLYWPLGLNPGIATSKIVGSTAQGPWSAASFIYRSDAPFARHHQAFRIESYASKGWLDPWEDFPTFRGGDSPRREAWRIDPQNRFARPAQRGFMTFVNGHVIWDDQWDYWNSGGPGWVSGETFIHADGPFLKAALLYEELVAATPAHRSNPYDTTKISFFDTTHVDRLGTGWIFDDPDRTPPGRASRAVHEFCLGKGFVGGRFTGHYLDERMGAQCVPQTARFFDANDSEINATGWDFSDIDTALWAQMSRAATGFCNTRGFVGGFFTGHQLNGRRGVVCLEDHDARWFDSTEKDLSGSGEDFRNINTVSWAKASRAATNICANKGYSGGFFTGHQLNGLRGVVCLAKN